MSSTDQQDFKGTERFLIQRRLGAGGFGVVYQAYDRERDSLVALKTLRSADAEALYRFKKEFRALADVTHPNLVALYELMSDGEQWFFTMELVDGVDFLQYVREKTNPERVGPLSHLSTREMEREVETRRRGKAETLRPRGTGIESQSPAASPRLPLPTLHLNIDRLRSALKQLAEGISILHQASKLHRDIKPSNVLVTREGRVVILDFGLVAELAPQGIHQSLEIAGTPAYMSPEQGAGLAVWEATDWYSIGVIFYEALTGRLPFVGQFLDVLVDKQRFEPPAPSNLMPGIPEDLDALCVDLLRRDPRERPSGHEVLRRLCGVEAEALRPIPATSSPIRAMPFVGREQHLAALREAFQAAKHGRAMTVYVHGRSGIGKTVLVRRFLEQLQQSEREVVVLAGRCYEQESVPYKALDSVVDALSQYLKRLSLLEAEALLPLDVLALARLFPVLRQVEAVARARRRVLEIPDSQELRRRAFAALRELLARLTDKKPVILFIDDLQWGDLDSAALLGELLRPPDPPALLLIGSYRSEEAETSPLLRTLLSSQATTGSAVEVREVVVGELPALEARELAFALLDEESAISMARAETIARESGGSPFFIDELVQYSKTEAETAKGWDDGVEKVEATLSEVIQVRVSHLPEEARRLLEIVAVSGQPLKRAVAKQAAELDIDEHKSLALLRAAHMIRSTAGSQDEIETYHDRIRETLVAHLPPETLKAHHHRLALALEASGRADPEKLAVHFQKAEAREKAAQYAVLAAERASEALAFDRAARLYQLALSLQSVEKPEKQSLRMNKLRVNTLCVKLGDALTNAGRGSEAARAYLLAVKGTVGPETLELQRRAAEQFLISGHIDEGLAVLRTVLGTVGMKLPETPRGALLSLLIRRAQIRLQGLRFRERDTTQVSARELLRIDACWSASLGLGMVDTIRGADFQARHLLLALRAGEPYRIARALAMEAGYSSTAGGRSSLRTEKLVQAAMAVAERINQRHALGLATFIAGLAAYCEGRWKRAKELTERAEGMLRERCAGVTWELDTTQVYSLLSLSYLGELNELLRRLPTLLKEVWERGDLYAITLLRIRISYIVRLAADEADEARKELPQAIEQWSQQGFYLQHYYYMLAQGEIELYCGEGKSAWNYITERWPAFTRSLLLRVQLILIESLHLRARSALAAAVATASPNSLLRTAERDAKRIEREKMPYGNSLALLIRAGIAATRGKVEEAIKLLALAEAGFEAADMALYAAAARRRRGQLIGGNEGRALVEAADNWMAGQKIKNPNRMTAMLAPGRWSK